MIKKPTTTDTARGWPYPWRVPSTQHYHHSCRMTLCRSRRFMFAGVALVVLFCCTLTAQTKLSSANSRIAVGDSSTGGQQSALPEEFKERVQARYKAARNGRIEVFLPATCKVGDTVTARVVIQRPPEGSDGMVLDPVHKDGSRDVSLLKVDDEMRVMLAVQESGAAELVPASADEPVLHRILPGGISEWIWHIKTQQRGELHFTTIAEVVYRRNFLSYQPPVIAFTSSTETLPLEVLP